MYVCMNVCMYVAMRACMYLCKISVYSKWTFPCWFYNPLPQKPMIYTAQMVRILFLFLQDLTSIHKKHITRDHLRRSKESVSSDVIVVDRHGSCIVITASLNTR